MTVKFSDIDLFLEPGQLYVSTEPSLVQTILGSCVAVCLHDRRSKVGGINHYVLPGPGGKGPADGRYGSSSIKLLVERMQAIGGVLGRLRAHVVGGARPVGGDRGPQVGAANRTVAFEMLRLYGIPILQEHTGGELARRVFFNTGTGKLTVVIIERSPTLWSAANRRTRR